jgi:hypothetical protein
VPTGFKRKFKVSVDPSFGPFDWKQEDAWHELN